MTIMDVMTIKPGEAKSPSGTTNLTSGAAFPVEKGDNGILLVLSSVSGGEATIQAGDGVFAGGSKTVTVPASEPVYLYLESGPFIQHTGENKGMIVIGPSDGVYGIAVQLI